MNQDKTNTKIAIYHLEVRVRVQNVQIEITCIILSFVDFCFFGMH